MGSGKNLVLAMFQQMEPEPRTIQRSSRVPMKANKTSRSFARNAPSRERNPLAMLSFDFFIDSGRPRPTTINCDGHRPPLQLNNLRRMNVAARPDGIQDFFARGAVQVKHGQCGAAFLISAQRHGGNIDAVFA